MQLVPGILVAATLTAFSLVPARAQAQAEVDGPPPALGTSTSTAVQATLPSTLQLTVGFAEILRVDGTIGTIVLGEPAVADASPLDAGTILLTGRRAGTTNLIALDEGGGVLADLTLHVGARQPGTVTVRRALDVQVYECAAGLCQGSSPPSAGPAPPSAETAPPVAGP